MQNCGRRRTQTKEKGSLAPKNIYGHEGERMCEDVSRAGDCGRLLSSSVSKNRCK